MSETSSAQATASSARPKSARPGTMRLIDATRYRLPPAGVVSILHRISGAVLFFLLPFIVWMFDNSLTSEISYEAFTTAFDPGIAVGAVTVPAWLVKLVVLALIWAYLFHAVAGIRHLWMDMTHSVSQQQGRVSALITLGLSSVLTLALGAKLFGLY